MENNLPTNNKYEWPHHDQLNRGSDVCSQSPAAAVQLGHHSTAKPIELLLHDTRTWSLDAQKSTLPLLHSSSAQNLPQHNIYTEYVSALISALAHAPEEVDHSHTGVDPGSSPPPMLGAPLALVFVPFWNSLLWFLREGGM